LVILAEERIYDERLLPEAEASPKPPSPVKRHWKRFAAKATNSCCRLLDFAAQPRFQIVIQSCATMWLRWFAHDFPFSG
jgi:hypothetical protein